MTRGHHECVTAIECRDRSRPVGAPQVEAFHQKCNDTGIHRSVIVSTKGFYKPAKIKASHYGIVCLRLDEVDSYDWILPGSIPFRQRRIVGANCTVMVQRRPAEVLPSNLEIQTDNGEVYSKEMLLADVSRGVDQQFGEDFVPVGSYSLHFTIGVPEGWVAVDSATGTQYKCGGIKTQTTVVVEEIQIPLVKLEYSDCDGDTPIGQAAVANIDSPPIFGDVVFSRRPDEGIELHFVAKKK